MLSRRRHLSPSSLPSPSLLIPFSLFLLLFPSFCFSVPLSFCLLLPLLHSLSLFSSDYYSTYSLLSSSQHLHISSHLPFYLPIPFSPFPSPSTLHSPLFSLLLSLFPCLPLPFCLPLPYSLLSLLTFSLPLPFSPHLLF